ncbi:hypothetical protein ACQPZ2_29660 [Nocardia pseudovaccinii]|uniref:hypothetical protein n=1 Tax=Nocardia pseudovaccinii TaxID=189540 RepID=UPI003D8DAA31
MPVADAARGLADRFGCSLRQARRYVDRAVVSGPMPVAEPTVVFSIKLKLPAALDVRVREIEQPVYLRGERRGGASLPGLDFICRRN